MLIGDRQPMLTASVHLVIADEALDLSMGCQRPVFPRDDQSHAASGAVLHLWWPSSASVHPARDVRQRSPGLSLCRRYFLAGPTDSAVLLAQWPQARREDSARTPQRRPLAGGQPVLCQESF